MPKNTDMGSLSNENYKDKDYDVGGAGSKEKLPFDPIADEANNDE